jgi:hypothetical protein
LSDYGSCPISLVKGPYVTAGGNQTHKKLLVPLNTMGHVSYCVCKGTRWGCSLELFSDLEMLIRMPSTLNAKLLTHAESNAQRALVIRQVESPL